MNFKSVALHFAQLLVLLIFICLQSGGGHLMHKMKMMKMMKKMKEQEHEKSIVIGLKPIKIPIPIPVAMPYVQQPQMMIKPEKGNKGKGMMMKMMDMHMKMKMMKMMMKMKGNEMKAHQMKAMKCKPCMMMKAAKCDQACPDACAEDTSCNSCQMKGNMMMMNNGWPSPMTNNDWTTTAMMMNKGWPSPAMMMNNGWPSPAMMMNNDWPMPVTKGMMKAMCPECPPCEEPMEIRPEEMEPDYYEEEVEDDHNAWDTNLVPVYQPLDDVVTRRGDDYDEMHPKNRIWNSIGSFSKFHEQQRNFEYDFEF